MHKVQFVERPQHCKHGDMQAWQAPPETTVIKEGQLEMHESKYK